MNAKIAAFLADMASKGYKTTTGGGTDPVKKKFFENYSKERKGAKHMADKPKIIENKNFKIEL